MNKYMTSHDSLCRPAQPYSFAAFPGGWPGKGLYLFRLLAGVFLPLFVLAAGPAMAQYVIGGGSGETVHAIRVYPEGLLLGFNGSGTLTIGPLGEVWSSGTRIGFRDEGTVVVGHDGELHNSGSLGVGYGRKGTLTIEAGGRVENLDGTIGFNGDGIVSVTGEGASWINYGEFLVGFQANAELTIEAGGRVESTLGMIGGGNRSDVAGTVLVTGEGSVWANVNEINVGDKSTGYLTIEAGGRVTSRNGGIGLGEDAVGSVTVSGTGEHGNASAWEIDETLTIGFQGAGALAIEDGGKVTSESAIIGSFVSGSIGEEVPSSGTVTVSGMSALGNASALEIDGILIAGEEGVGTLTIEEGGRVTNAAAIIGSGGTDGISPFSSGTVTVSGTNALGNASTWEIDEIFIIGLSGAATGTVTIADGGMVRVDDGIGTVTLALLEAPMGGPRGVLNIGAGLDDDGNPLAATAAGFLEAGSVEFGAGTGALNFNHTGNRDGSDVVFAPAIASGTGAASINQIAGTTVLNADSAGFAGTTNVSGGRLVVADALGGTASVTGGELQVDGVFGGGVTVSGAGAVSGAGRIAGDLDVVSGGTLSGMGGRTLGIDGDLTLDADSNVNVALGATPAGGLFDVGGDLRLDGTLNVTDTGGFGMGVYRLFDYDGLLSGDGLSIGVTPGGVGRDNLFIQTSEADQVNLISTAGAELAFWDGGDTGLHGNGQIDGGDGVWRAGGFNWAEATGALNGPYQPNPTFAIFQGGSGTVTVDAQGGAIGVTGMQFVTDGYVIDGDAIALQGVGESIIRVGDGTAASADITTTIAAALTGDNRLVKTDPGTLVLTGSNAYGDTHVQDGRLIGDAGSISGDIANAGIVSFEQGTNASFTGDIAGLGGTEGKMIKDGLGTLALEGISNLDWTIAAGGLVTDAARFGGNVRLDGAATTLNFGDSGNAAYGGEISGTGQFSLDGGGTVLLTGDSSGFSGRTVVNGGTLLVGDSNGNGALGGSLDVLAGGTLGGSGTIGSGTGSLVTVASGGTLEPGNSIGTLTVDGDLVFAADSRFAVEVNPSGTEGDLVTVTGNAALGGSVAHIGANGEYDLRSTHTILSAGGTLSGAFDEVSSDFAFLTPDLLYDYGAGTVALELTRNDRDFASVALTPNQIATAGGIESIGFDAGHAVYDAVAQLADDEDLIRTSFDGLSGEIHASARTALIEDSRFIRNAANDRIRAAFGNAGASYAPVLAYGPGDTPALVAADHGGPVVWSHGFGSWGATDSDGNAASLDRSTGGLLVGTDTLVGDWRLGVLGGYSHSSFDVDDRAATGSSDNYHLGLYGGTQWGDIAFRTGAAYTWHDIDTRRSVSIPGLADALSGDYGAGTFQAFGELGYGFDLDHATRLEPFVNLAHVSLHTDGFGETGGDAALSVNGGSTDVTFTTLGLRGEHAMTLGTMDATLRGMVGWRHAFGDITPESTHALSAGNAFTIAGTPIARDSAVIEVGLDLNISPDATFGLSYTGQIASDAYDHGFTAKLGVRF